MRIDNYNKQNIINNDKDNFELTDEQLEYLYEQGINELSELNKTTETYKEILKDSFYGKMMFQEDTTSVFFDTLYMLFNTILPATLQGDYDTLLEALDVNISEEEFNIARAQLYIMLTEKFLK